MRPKKKNSVSEIRLAELKKRAERDHTGIYAIFNKVNGKYYVGQSICMLDRMKSHFYELDKNRHCNLHLQNSYNLYGKNAFEFIVLETCREHELSEREQYWIDELKAEYNIAKSVYTEIDIETKEYCKDGESFPRPTWHAWAYGGAKNPLCNR